MSILSCGHKGGTSYGVDLTTDKTFCDACATARNVENAQIPKSIIYAIWAEAYDLGFTDAKQGKDPNERVNPYA
jgi:hypothetical protein